MIQNKEETEYKSGLSGMGGNSNKVDHLSGWFLNFFAYIGDGDGDYKQYKIKSLKVEDFEKFPSQMLIVPFKIININFPFFGFNHFINMRNNLIYIPTKFIFL